MTGILMNNLRPEEMIFDGPVEATQVGGSMPVLASTGISAGVDSFVANLAQGKGNSGSRGI